MNESRGVFSCTISTVVRSVGLKHGSAQTRMGYGSSPNEQLRDMKIIEITKKVSLI